MSEENASTHESEGIGAMAGDMAQSLLGSQNNDAPNEEENENETNNEEENENEANNEEENVNEANNEEENENEANNEEENQNEENNEANNEEENQNEQSEKAENKDGDNLGGMVDGLTGQLIGSADNKSEASKSKQASEEHTPAGSRPHTPSQSRSSRARNSSNNSANISQKSLNAIAADKADALINNDDHSKTMPPPAVHEPASSAGSQKSGRGRRSNATNQSQQTNKSKQLSQAPNITEEEDEYSYYSQYDEFQDGNCTGSSWANRLSRSELDDLVLSVICGETPVEKVPPTQLPQLISGLKEARDERISRRKPDEAEVCDSYLLIARHAYNEHMKVVAQQTRSEKIRKRLEQAKEDLESLRDNIDLEEAKQASVNENQVMDLLDRQQADDDEFRKSWRSPQKLRIYNRTSNQLRSLKTQTILLLNARKYNEMRQVDRLAKKQEEIETEANYQQMNSEYIQSHQNLQRKHMDEMKTLIDSQETKNEQKKALAKIKMDIAQRRVDNLQAQYNELMDPNKVWNLYHRHDRSKADTKKSATRKRLETRNYTTLALPPLQTPRSARTRSMRYSGL
ncbi:hypothetical protein M9Y10_004480 [Tritrichomonas musculus]|uniref:DUF4201 domain-containing protein n=1 Tax=Tritrichomonas musculus TaxID=1915356 RepID=A0ABR2JV25_9EUKA